MLALRDLITRCGLKQYVNCITHNSGHTIDLILTKEEFKFNLTEPENVFPISDHGIIKFCLDISKPPVVRQVLEYRKLKKINHTDLKADLEILVNKLLVPDYNPQCLVSDFTSGLAVLLNRYAPLVRKSIICKDKPEWVTDEVLALKRSVRRAENKWRQFPNDVHKSTLTRLKRDYRNQTKKSKWDHVNQVITNCGRDSKKLFNVVNKLIGKTQCNPLPEHDDNTYLANEFANFFMGKIHTIRDDLQDHPLFKPPVRDCKKFSAFRPLEEKEVMKLIQQANPTNCPTDPFPAKLLKVHLQTIIPVLTLIVNNSLTTGSFSSLWKTSIVCPLLKKPGLDLILSNYRPVNKLPFLSKIVEKGMLIQLNDHLSNENLLPDYISAYRESYSTETALIKVTNDILLNIDQQRVTPLVALDLSAAFDTVDHSVLLRVLQNQFGVNGVALDWFRNYLQERKIKVMIDKSFSEELHLPFSVPQGSCAGPVAYNLYASTLKDYIATNTCDKERQVSILGYADDHAYYDSFKANRPNDEAHCVTALEDCAKTISNWMNENRLKLNNSKTEYIKFASKSQLKKCVTKGININDVYIQESNGMKYLGVWLDAELSFDKHISEKCRIAMYNLHRLRVLRSYLDRKSLEQLVHSLVISQLDYCSTLFYGIPKSSVKKLQRVQNFAAKLILNRRKYDSATECLKELHWLPFNSRILFRLLCMSYKCVNGLAPNYLTTFFNVKKTKYALRSTTTYHVPPTQRKSFGDRAFSVGGPKEWNNLPPEIKTSSNFCTFKKKLKTHLFRNAFQ